MRTGIVIAILLSIVQSLHAVAPDLILHHGKVVTVDDAFSIASAVAVTGTRITAVGSDDAILSLAGPETEKVDLAGKMLLPGLIDSHVHPVGAATYEFDHAVPDVETLQDALAYIKSRADVLPDGEWSCPADVHHACGSDSAVHNQQRDVDV